ncbi:MAG: DNA methyltransferase [Pirellulaceae bacterium]|nr:DNA methyltransferase [Pirellulaceae bacterium]
MPQLSWPEVRDRALAFASRWAGEASEAAGKQTFWNEFFAVFGRDRRTVAAFEVAVRNLGGDRNFIDLLWRGMLLVEHKSFGKSLALAETQAFGYIADLARDGRSDEIPRYVIVSDFARFVLYDLEPDESQPQTELAGLRFATTSFPLAELHLNIRSLAFLKGEQPIRLDPEDPANEKAYRLMCQLHDELELAGFHGTDLERLLVRLLFCLFADDTGVFEPATFETYIRAQTREDGTDVGPRLNQLFDVLNKPAERWRPAERELFAGFRYINGDLFREPLDFPPFGRGTRAALLAACEFQWARVSPAVFGSLFQGILDAQQRRRQGAHYTSERDILKVVRSLFMDELRAEFEAVRGDRSTRRRARLEDFHARLRGLQFLDPACGCGNFLVVGYRELRQLELELLKERHADAQQMLDVAALIRVDVDQFHGIEIDEWPARIAEVALWLMDHQMNQRVSEAFGKSFERLPLQSSPHIVQANALRMDWRNVLRPGDEVRVLGNPPFIGKQYRTAEQQADMAAIWGEVPGAGVLDYVTCWYRKGAEYIAGTAARVAFVSTNSITQGEQVGVLWQELFERFGIKIHFGHRTFPWTSEARGKAHVHVVVVGFAASDSPNKRLYDYEAGEEQVVVRTVRNISPYLIEGPDLALAKRSTPLGDVPPISFGSMPNDGGHLLLTSEEKAELVAREPEAAPFVHPFVGAEEFINGQERWCLWLVEAGAAQLRQLPLVRERIRAVQKHRQASARATTRELATLAHLFGEIRQPTTNYLLIPGVSSETRRYIPIGFLRPNVIASNLVNVVPGASLYHFGVLTSRMHMAWVRQVCGRLESRFRYSSQIVYNNFPWPVEISAAKEARVVEGAERVLEVRRACGDGRHGYLPVKKKDAAASLADLYDPLTMPGPLVKAHAALDRAVERCYQSAPFASDRERVEHLFALYERLAAPLLPARTSSSRRRAPRTDPE